LKSQEEASPIPPGHVVNDTLPRYNRKEYIVGSDGSVHLRDKVAAAAWLITTREDTDHISACFLMSDISSVSSYRAELEGVFRALKHIEYLNIPPAEIIQWCDNKQSVCSSINPPPHPSSMLEPDADLILAIHELKQSMKHKVNIRHVYGHQDGQGKAKAEKRKRQKQEDYEKRLQEWEERSEPDSSESETETVVRSMFNPSPEGAPTPPEEEDEAQKKLEVEVNVECDRIATDTTAAAKQGGVPPVEEVLQMPYAGSKAMLHINGVWITSKYKNEIYKARRTKEMRRYCKDKYKWTDEVFDSVHWESIRTVRAKSKQTKKMQTCKINPNPNPNPNPNLVKQQWVKQLDKIREAFRVENRTRMRGQNAITQYLVRVRDGIT